MKRVMYRLSNVVLMSAVIVALTAGTVSATEKTPVKNNNEVAVTYLGTINETPVLNVAYENAAKEKATIIITDGYGEVLFAETFTGKSFTKKIGFDNPNDENITFKVTINTKNSSHSKLYTIKTSSRFVSEVALNEVN